MQRKIRLFKRHLILLMGPLRITFHFDEMVVAPRTRTISLRMAKGWRLGHSPRLSITPQYAMVRP
ncbi:MAG: hypothetical protein WCG62_03510, partial [Actinomycetes bacterium]